MALCLHPNAPDKLMMRIKPLFFLLMAACILVSCATISSPAPAEPPVSTPAAMNTNLPPATTTPPFEQYGSDYQAVRLAWFYKPPASGNLASLAENYDFFILTRMDEQERDTLQSMGVDAPILQYLVFAEAQDPGGCSEQPNHNQVAEDIGDFCELTSQHPDWFLRDSLGNILVNDDGYTIMDPGNSGWRNYWLERAKTSQDVWKWQGVFLDNVEASLEKRLRYLGFPRDYPDDASYQAVIEDNLRFLYTTYFQPSGRPLYANIISIKDPEVWFRYLQYLDGAMLENFAVGWNEDYKDVSDWETQMEIAEKTQALGKEIILVAQGTQFDHQRQTFALASYLLVNNGKAYFRYSNDLAYDQDWAYDNYFEPLGLPLGPRYPVGDSWVRDFQKGRVQVNPVLNSAGIEYQNGR